MPRSRRVVVTWLGAALVVAALSLPAAIAGDDPPAADSKERDKVRQTFRADFSRLQTPRDKDALARKLVATANRSLSNVARRGALLDEAFDLAVEAGAVNVALAIAGGRYPTGLAETIGCKRDALRKLADAELSEDARDLLESHVNYTRSEAVHAEQYDVARELVEMSSSFPHPKPQAAAEERANHLRDIDELETLRQAFNEAQAILEATPDDAEANRTVGMYEGFLHNDWRTGKKHLERAKDELVGLLKREEKPPKEIAALIELGDAWMTRADGVPRMYRAQVLGHAFSAFAGVNINRCTSEQKKHVLAQLDIISKGSKDVLGWSPPPDTSDSPLVKTPLRSKPVASTAGGTPKKTANSTPGSTMSPARSTTPAAKTEPTAKIAAPAVKTKPAEKPAPPFSVVSARYGSTSAGTDLTERMQAASKGGLLVVFVESSLASDKQQGELYLRVKTGTATNDLKFTHRQFVLLDHRPAPKIADQGLQILDAWYGAGILGEKKMVDVKDLLAAEVADDRVSLPVKKLIGSVADPAFGVFKALIVRYALDGQIKTELFDEDEEVKLGGK